MSTSYTVINPATEQPVAEVPQADLAETDAPDRSGRAGFPRLA